MRYREGQVAWHLAILIFAGGAVGGLALAWLLLTIIKLIFGELFVRNVTMQGALDVARQSFPPGPVLIVICTVLLWVFLWIKLMARPREH